MAALAGWRLTPAAAPVRPAPPIADLSNLAPSPHRGVPARIEGQIAGVMLGGVRFRMETSYGQEVEVAVATPTGVGVLGHAQAVPASTLRQGMIVDVIGILAGSRLLTADTVTIIPPGMTGLVRPAADD